MSDCQSSSVTSSSDFSSVARKAAAQISEQKPDMSRSDLSFTSEHIDYEV